MKTLPVLILVFFLLGCTHTLGLRIRKTTRIERHFLASKDWESHVTGLGIYDPVRKTWLLEHQADKYFTPASNAKLFTYYTALQALGDSIATLAYWQEADTLCFQTLGAPSFLHPAYSSQPAYDLLANTPLRLCYVPAASRIPKYGPGWAWDDDSFAFQAERSVFPVYGNSLRLLKSERHPQGFHTIPAFFSAFVEKNTLPNTPPHRDRHVNLFFYDAERRPRTEVRIPFHYSEGLALRLLSDTLQRSIAHRPAISTTQPKTLLYGQSSQVLYRHMLRSSSNFVAEQLLVACAAALKMDTLSPRAVNAYALKHYLDFLSHRPVWVDGSGLSRYNLATPRSLVELLERLYHEVGIEDLRQVLAVGGEAGTLASWEFAEDTPFVFAKTGTLSHHFALSGFLQAASGRWLIFSFMHAHHTKPTKALHAQIKDFLSYVRKSY